MQKRLLQKRVWCELPDALLERMLPLLPLPSLLRFRCVCKSWNSYILSSDFLQLCPSSAPASSSLGDLSDQSDNSSYPLLSTWSSDYPLLAFNPSRQTWHLPSLDFLFKGTRSQELGTVSFSLIAAAGGLLCLSCGEGKFIVCNPITKAKREIECKVEGEGDEGLITNLVMASMRYNEARRGFQLLMVGTCEGDGGRQATYVYDSREHVWKACRKQRETFFFESNGVFLGDDFFVLNSFPIKLLVFNTATGMWRDHPAQLPTAVRHPSLVQIGGKLLLLAAMESCDGEGVEGYKVWRLEEEGHVEGGDERHMWREVAVMPEDMFGRVAGSEHFEGLSCVAHGHVIYLTSSEGCLLYDSSLMSWSWLPHSPILGNLFACIKDVYAMEPSLDTVN